MKHNRLTLLVLVALLVVLLSACAAQTSTSMNSELMKNETMKAELPVDTGYAEGKTISFAHTEASDAEIAKKMEAGMKSPVLYVSSLNSVPENALANVYVFTNGVKGASMSGLQPSVFDNPPGTNEYTPLRRLNVVTWKDAAQARELKSATEVLEAAKSGELTIQQPGVVINMPFVVWEGSKR